MIHFGTGGWRAIIGDEFTRANIELLVTGLARKIKAEGQADRGIVIGYDRRFLSEEAAKWSCQTLAAEGVSSYLVKREAPTPLVMFSVKQHDLPYGLCVTASHNPALYNGIKVFMSGGRDADEVVTNDLESFMEQVEAEQSILPAMDFDMALESGLIRIVNPFNDYIDSIMEQVDMEAIRKSGLHIALDPMFGVSKTSLQTLLMTARCEVDVIHERRDTLFGGRLPAPNSKTMVALQSFVLENNCDIGIATDGDADRLGIIDDTGKFLHPNQILVLLYYYLVKYKGWKGPVVRNIATTHLLDRLADYLGETCYEVPVGFKHISSKMLETDAVIGGESSGGMTVRGHIAGKDGIYAASLLVEMIAVVGKKLSVIYDEVTSLFDPHYMEETDFRFPAERKEEIHQTLMIDQKLPTFKYAVDHVSYLDGCKVYFENGGWIIARFSGTEPLLRIFCEMSNEADAVDTCNVFRTFLNL